MKKSAEKKRRKGETSKRWKMTEEKKKTRESVKHAGAKQRQIYRHTIETTEERFLSTDNSRQACFERKNGKDLI